MKPHEGDKHLARTKIPLSLSVLSQYCFDGGVCFFHFVLNLFVLIFVEVFDLFSLTSLTISPQPFPSIIATMWTKDDFPNGLCGSGRSRMDGKVSSSS